MPIRIMETTPFLAKTHNWKSPERDKIPNYQLMAFPLTHSCIIKIFNIVTEEPKQIPVWLTTQITYYFLNQKVLRNKEVID
jgi:hypothetical protein